MPLNGAKSGTAQLGCHSPRFRFWHVWNLNNYYLRVSYEKRISTRNGHVLFLLLLSTRVKAMEGGQCPAFSEGLTEGVSDIEDLKLRTNELTDFVETASVVCGFGSKKSHGCCLF